MQACSTSGSVAVRQQARDTSLCSASIALLDFRAQVSGPRHVVEDVRVLFPLRPAPLAPACAPTTVDTAVSFHVRTDVPFHGWHSIARDGQLLWSTECERALSPFLEWAVTTGAVRHLAAKYLLFHAGAIAFGGQGLLLPADAGSGKTTLTAALLRAGFQYLNDEIAVLHPTSGQVLPFARSLCVKQGGRRVLGDLYADLLAAAPRRRFGREQVWYLQPPDEVWSATPVPVRYIVFPRYVAGATTTLTPLARSVALPLLLQQAFNARRLGPAAISSTVRLLQSADCYCLTIGSLPTAIEQLRQLVSNE